MKIKLKKVHEDMKLKLRILIRNTDAPVCEPVPAIVKIILA